MAEINLIKIDGKPLEKLIDVISKGIGTVYKPRAIKKEAEAEAYKIEIIERAKSKALAEGKEIEQSTYERIEERLLHKEIKRQNNIDNVAQIAADQLSHESHISDEPVDEDWTTRFFNIIEDVSSEEMQHLWGKILAGEVKQPKSYSLRTLELLKNLSKNEAECFMEFAKFAIMHNHNYYLLNPNYEKLLLNKFGLNMNKRLLLDELLLINNIDLQITINKTDQTPRSEAFLIGRTCVIAELDKNFSEFKINVLAFTKSGQELLQLIENEAEMDYIKLIASKFRRNKAKVKYAEYKKVKKDFKLQSELREVPLSDDEIKIQKDMEELTNLFKSE